MWDSQEKTYSPSVSHSFSLPTHSDAAIWFRHPKDNSGVIATTARCCARQPGHSIPSSRHFQNRPSWCWQSGVGYRTAATLGICVTLQQGLFPGGSGPQYPPRHWCLLPCNLCLPSTLHPCTGAFSKSQPCLQETHVPPLFNLQPLEGNPVLQVRSALALIHWAAGKCLNPRN